MYVAIIIVLRTICKEQPFFIDYFTDTTYPYSHGRFQFGPSSRAQIGMQVYLRQNYIPCSQRMNSLLRVSHWTAFIFLLFIANSNMSLIKMLFWELEEIKTISFRCFSLHEMTKIVHSSIVCHVAGNLCGYLHDKRESPRVLNLTGCSH